jgi:hypothetical protein
MARLSERVGYKQNFELVLKTNDHFQSMTHSILKTEISNVNCHMLIQNTILIIFRFIRRWCLQRKYMCRQHETLHCRKLHKSYENRVTEVVKDMCDN